MRLPLVLLCTLVIGESLLLVLGLPRSVIKLHFFLVRLCVMICALVNFCLFFFLYLQYQAH